MTFVSPPPPFYQHKHLYYEILLVSRFPKFPHTSTSYNFHPQNIRLTPPPSTLRIDLDELYSYFVMLWWFPANYKFDTTPSKKIALKHKMIYRFWFTEIINTFNIVVIQYIPFEKIILSCQFILHRFPNQNRHLCWNDFEPNPC